MTGIRATVETGTAIQDAAASRYTRDVSLPRTFGQVDSAAPGT